MNEDNHNWVEDDYQCSDECDKPTFTCSTCDAQKDCSGAINEFN